MKTEGIDNRQVGLRKIAKNFCDEFCRLRSRYFGSFILLFECIVDLSETRKEGLEQVQSVG